MRGIDISNWQQGLDISKLKIDFAIMKATEGNYYVDPFCDNWVSQCKEKGIKWGFYHFANNNNPIVEADFFISKTKGYFGHGIPVLDIEDNNISNWGDYASKFCKRVHDKTKVWPVIYCSASQCARFDGYSAADNCGLWCAGYPYTMHSWTSEDFPYNVYPWSNVLMWQFTSNLYLSGYDSRLDGNIAYISKKQWDAYATGDRKKKESKDNPKPKPKKKTVSDVAYEVILGEYGNGKDRIKALKKAGYNYKTVQTMVNDMYAVAHEVIRGDYGNGQDRIDRLANAGYNPRAIQYIVNLLLK